MGCKEDLEAYLRENKVPFQVQHHAVAYTAQEVAAAEHVPGRMLAKVVMLTGDGKLCMFVLPAPARVDPVLLASGPSLSGPEIAWNGSLYLTVWSDPDIDKILGLRLTADGTVLDDPPITIMSGLEPDVAAVGGDFLVVGTDAVGGPTTRKPFAARVRGSDGVVLDDPTPILLGQSYARAPKVAGMITRWIATWERHPTHDDEAASVWTTDSARASGPIQGAHGARCEGMAEGVYRRLCPQGR